MKGRFTMNTRIKMRGWHREDKIFYRVYGFNFVTDTIYRDKFPFGQQEPLNSIHVVEDSLLKYDVDFWSGIRDKYARDVYENDFLYHRDDGLSVVFYPYNHKLGPFGFAPDKINTHYTYGEPYLYELVGNTYENPELIKTYNEQ